MPPSMVSRRGLAVAALAMGSGRAAAAATSCPQTGEAAPEVRTLMASTTTPATEAWIVDPDCTVLKLSLTTENGGDGVLVADLDAIGSIPIDLVVSVPSETAVVSLGGSPLSRAADFSMAKKALKVEISGVPSDIRKLVLPPSLQSLSFQYKSAVPEITSLDGIKLPSTLIEFELDFNQITSLKNVQFPSSLESLTVWGGPLKTIDFQLPTSLKNLVFVGMMAVSFGDFDRLTLPSGLESFEVRDSLPATIQGVRWPSTLTKFNFMDTTITSFEIRQSDLAIFNKLADSGALTANVRQTDCTAPATLGIVGGVSLCVMSDADFDALYGLPPTPAPAPTSGSSERPSTPANSNLASWTGSGDDDSSTSADTPSKATGSEPFREPSTRRPAAPRVVAGNSLTPDTSVEETTLDEASATSSSVKMNGTPTTKSPISPSNTSSVGTAGVSPKAPSLPSSPTQSPQDSQESPTTNGTSSGGSRTSLTAIILACILSFVVGGIVYHALVRAKKRRGKDPKLVDDSTNDNYTSIGTPTTSFETQPATEPNASAPVAVALETLRVAFMTDQDLVSSRIDQVQVGEQIAEGGSGVVHRGSYEGRTVAVKQLPPEAWTNDTLVAKFLDEIRLCTRLDHPKIVEFIGATWSGGRDLAAVSEFMAGGDLKSILQKHPSSTGGEWASPWTTNELRSKTLIALDIVEAVVYLHSFSSPIIHRDLKAKNVLLDTKGNAKLSDFGISREMSFDETMTSDVGTAAWIAPEVLRGERYDEKADIYSLGVLLVEMDRCSHPYANEPKLMTENDSSKSDDARANTGVVAHKNTQIAVLVSTGQLRPSPTAQCPEDIEKVVARCLTYGPNDRPTAMEVFYQLRQVRKSQENSPTTDN